MVLVDNRNAMIRYKFVMARVMEMIKFLMSRVNKIQQKNVVDMGDKGSHQKMKNPKVGTLSQQGAGGLTRRVGCPNRPIW